MIDTFYQVLDRLPPLRGHRSPQLSAAVGFFSGGIGLGIYFWSVVDVILPVFLCILLMVSAGLLEIPFMLAVLVGGLFAGVYGFFRAATSNARLGSQAVPSPLATIRGVGTIVAFVGIEGMLALTHLVGHSASGMTSHRPDYSSGLQVNQPSWSAPPAPAAPPTGMVSMLGSWQGRYLFDGHPIDCVYTFRNDGVIVEQQYRAGQLVGSGGGRYWFAPGQLTIQWANGSIERGTVSLSDADCFRYQITSHSGDPRQVGLVVFYRRLV